MLAALEDLRFQALIESPAGLEAAYEIARHPRVQGISLGESDLRSATGALETGLDWPRGRIVNAAVAAGLPRPPQSVYPHVRDLDGLAESCRRGRAVGHLGRSAIHPDQLEVIEREYLPTDDEVERARATVERLTAGVGTLLSGEFVDAAMLVGAQQTLALAERYG
jgi:citrate lyase subunit beta/citryl-CoA lyase